MSELTTGQSGFPDGWSHPGADGDGMVWVEQRPATDDDIAALNKHYQDRGLPEPNIDEGTLCGKADKENYESAAMKKAKEPPPSTKIG